MEKDFGSWFLHQQSDRVSPNLDTLSAPFNLKQPNLFPAYMSHCDNAVSANGTLPWFPFWGFPNSKAIPPVEPHGWFNCSPHFQSAFASTSSTIFKEKIPADLRENRVEVLTADKSSGHDQKRFLVFDQSGDQTTMIFSPDFGTPVHCLTSLRQNLNNAYDLNKSELGTGRGTIHHPLPNLTDGCNENEKDYAESEMHEDTEELNALLYSSEDDDYYEDDEETSTGHSPSTMTAYDNKREWSDEMEEVASSGGPTKRVKLSDGGYDFPSLLDTASSVKPPERRFDYEDDAESSCADFKNQNLGESVSLVGSKRSRREKIRETVSVLQDLIPFGKGKDAIVILDEAISYLKSLKHKAEALGVDTL